MFYLLVFISNQLLKNSNAAPPDKTLYCHPFRFPCSSDMLSRRQAYPKHIPKISPTSIRHLSSNPQTYFGRPSNPPPTILKPHSSLSQLTFKPTSNNTPPLSQVTFKPLPSYPPVNRSSPSSNSRLSYLGNATCHFCNDLLPSQRQRYNKILTLSTPTRDNVPKLRTFLWYGIGYFCVDAAIADKYM